ncbi:MAG: TonB-dependent receptor [Acidobacteriota bacterium]
MSLVRARFAIALFALLLTAVPTSASTPDGTRITGVVVDANGGERLARVRIRIEGAAGETVTNDAGAFVFDNLAPGPHTLLVETVGYRLHRATVVTSADTTTEVTLALTADAVRISESVTVSADPFVSSVPAVPASPSQMQIGAAEIRALSSVLLDDPMRSMSSMPGVSVPDDYHAEFSVRGAPFARVGVFLDDVPMRAPTHTFGGLGDGYSISALNDQVLQSMTLLPAAPPPSFGGTTGAAVVAETRDGSREKTAVHASVGLSDVNLLAEGPLPSDKRGSWFVTARKSHLSYVINQMGGNSDAEVVFKDVQGKVTYDLTPKHTVSLHVLAGDSQFDAGLVKNSNFDTGAASTGSAGPPPGDGGRFTNVPVTSGSTALIKANWRFIPSSTLVVNSTVAYQHGHDDAESREGDALASSRHADASAQANASWFWTPTSPLRIGYQVRRTSDSGTSYLSLYENPAFRAANVYDGRSLSQNGFAEQQWASPSGRLRLTGGIRWQSSDQVGRDAVLPFLSSSIQVGAASKIELGWGQYAQSPDIEMTSLAPEGVSLTAERSTHYVAAFEHRLDPQTRFRIEAFARDDRGVFGVSDIYPRLQAGRVTWPSSSARWTNAYDGYSRGVELVLQRRSASRLTGWIGYTLGYNRQRDNGTYAWFDSDSDIRHTLNLYGGYRVTPSINLSARFNYASGAPVPGYFVVSDLTAETAQVSDVRNTSRFSGYQRLDLRVNKSFVFGRSKMTVYAEIMNATNHKNLRNMGFSGNFKDQAFPHFGSTLPRIPSLGVSIDF